jgi:lipopolysaccharide/colanic/teichoic acid biosynthesis glycosyltransferase
MDPQTVKPGLTGLWQVSRDHGTELSFEDIARLDSYYAEHRSFTMNVAILLKSGFAVIRDLCASRRC